MSTFWRLIDWLRGGGADLFESHAESTSTHEDLGCTINPASGLPMLGGFGCGGGYCCGGVDVAGNPYGTDLHAGHDSSISADFMNDDWHSATGPSSSWDD